MPPRFSVIIPTHNRAALLQAAIASVFAQRFTDFEVIVVDDGSTDGTRQLLAEYGDRLQVHWQAQGGPGAARNAGAARAQGDYLAFLDSDDMWFPWSLDIYDRVLSSYDRPAFLAGRPALFAVNDELSRSSETPAELSAFRDYYASGDAWRWWGASSFVVRADCFRSVGGFAVARINGEDADLAMRLGVSPGFVQVRQPVTFAYRQHQNGISGEFDRTLAGAWLAIRAERCGDYPGGRLRAAERQRILGRHVRPVMLELLRQGRRAEALRMFRSTAGWHVSEGRVRFLLGFPMLTLRSFWPRV